MFYQDGDYLLPFYINQTDLLAGTTQYLSSPVAGFIEEIECVATVAITTGGVIKAKLGSTDVAGATVTFANTSTVGTVHNASSTRGSSTAKVAKSGAIQIVVDAAFASAGAVNGWVRITGGA